MSERRFVTRALLAKAIERAHINQSEGAWNDAMRIFEALPAPQALIGARESWHGASSLDIGTLLRLARCGHVQFDPANETTARYRLDAHGLDYRYFLAELNDLLKDQP